ncbi:MAG: GGDEF domain-containing protein, partial [Phycisphaerae bacterium]
DAVGSGEASGDVGAVVGRARAVVVDDVRRARRFEMSAIGRRVARASYRSFLGMLIGIGGAAAAVGLAVMLGVVRWRAFARPIGALRRSVDELGRGSWDARIVNTHRGDELGSLVDAFNDMAAQLADAHAELRELSRTDPLTKLLNRRAWEEAVGQAHEQFERYGRPYSVVLVDVDYFKAYNDAAGHQAGDACLVRIAGAMASVGRGLDVVGRYGGEEFVVLARETSLAAALSLAERVRCVIWELNIPHPGRAVLGRVTASVGVAMGKPGTWEHTLKEADDALYIAKRSGRNVVYGNKTPPHGDTNAASNTSPSGTTATPPAARIAPSHTVHSAPRNQPVP